MNASAVDEDYQTLSPTQEILSPRKRMRLENSARKSWSLMDRRTDTEVLQEMGVSLLEQDDSEIQCDSINTNTKSLKRKHDIENVNPNVNYVASPKSCNTKYAKTKPSPCPGTSKISPRSCEKAPLQEILETSFTEEYLIEEETPLNQIGADRYTKGGYSVTSTGGRKLNTTLIGEEEEAILSRRSREEPQGEDSFRSLSDEVILSVFKWLPKRTLAHCMMVCKRWYRVACDETLWQRLDLGNKTLSKNSIGRILSRKPVILRLSSSEIGTWKPETVSPSRLQYLDLSMCSIDCGTLECLLEHCPALRKLSVENLNLSRRALGLIGKCNYMETLNLAMSQGIDEDGLRDILKGCPNLQSLNISWCNLAERTLQELVETLPQKLLRLNISGARKMTDEMVSALVTRCPRLLELDLSDCSSLGKDALTALLPLSRLEHLALSRCYLLPPHALTKLSSMSSLQYLEVWGMLPSTSLNVLKTTLPAIQVNKFMFSAIARPTIGTKRTSIWGLRTRD
ncbi:S-phase kinase-associated protein 2 [Pieris rapae]|uniref:S-phase kinase-associated protein 2 n=1 Tax=Pieris rapae TaxID=64459 RepID=UPI001E27F501|nr:S-phase kinase-associated protein 2 [Pieris rapae]